jgi:hypothetical protein
MTDDSEYYCPIMGAWLPRRQIYRETIVQDEALCRAIEQHEAYKQEVSDAVESALLDAEDGATIRNNLSQFIIPKPKPKPDPLVEVLADLSCFQCGEAQAIDLLAALDALGLEIRSKNDEQ